MSTPAPEISPLHIFDTLNAYQRSAALKAAIELDIFTAIAESQGTVRAVAERCGASERGTRILCDYMVVNGFLQKEGESYRLTPGTEVFLNKNSPAYMGGAIEFLLSPELMENFDRLTDCVRQGGTALTDEGTVSDDNPVWVKFARAMMALQGMPSQALAELVDREAKAPLKVLDIAAGHGMFGIALARRNTLAEVTALDWANVLELARENAEQAGVGERYRTLPGSAFELDYGEGYDLILLTNFLHHFDPETNERLLRKVHAALADGGRAVTLEFIPNEDRVTPPAAAAFSIVMLASTPSGDAYTLPEFEKMFRHAGFQRTEMQDLPPTFQRVLISYK
ncbi:MAG TPA: class I SAM-dependent methyltransferase [Pyrinomonadaceae bacterium]|jgi:2-polyprenyl-3-methyl-5-hydroxy-6-metoxy-1,4-benzoquinol methylase